MKIHPLIPLCDQEQKAKLDAKLAAVLAGPQPKRPSDAAKWPKRATKGSVIRDWCQQHGISFDPPPDPPDLRGFLIPKE